MTPEERFERIEQNLAAMAESHKEFQKEHDEAIKRHDDWLKRHEEALASHDSWLLDQERWTRGHEQWKAEMELTLKAMAANQALTEFKLQAFIESLRRGGNGKN
jgi:hypothetical protein